MMTKRVWVNVVAFLVGVVLAAGAVFANAQSLEVRTVSKITPDGVVLTDAGCYEYGALVATLAEARHQGVSRVLYDAYVADHPAAKHQPKMAEFIRQVIDAVYTWPTGTYAGKALDIKKKYTEQCRSVEGRSWQLILFEKV
jgi:hypothetical protein